MKASAPYDRVALIASTTKARRKGAERRVIGCDFLPPYQQFAALNKATGEIVERRLSQEGKEAEAFYESLPRGALVGMEATCAARWFERLLDRCGHLLWVRDSAQIRALAVRKQKTDARDAQHLLHYHGTGQFFRNAANELLARERPWFQFSQSRIAGSIHSTHSGRQLSPAQIPSVVLLARPDWQNTCSARENRASPPSRCLTDQRRLSRSPLSCLE